MKYVIVLVAIFAAVTANPTDDEKNNVKAVAKKCVASSGVEKSVLQDVRTGTFHDDDAKLKDFLFCLFLKLQFIDEHATILTSVEKSKAFLPSDLTDAEKTEIVTTCNAKTGSSPQDTVYLIYKCFRQSSNYETLI